MNRSSETVEDRARKTFCKRRIMTLEEVAKLIHSSIHTARRRLKSWRAHTSYNHNGRYYTLPDGAEFDADGLWKWKGVFFSRDGNLKQTVVEQVRRSRAGLDGAEMRSLLGLDPRSFLSAFAEHPRIRREKAQGRFVYYSSDKAVHSKQRQRRCALSAKGRQPSAFEAIAILVEKIKRPDLSNKALSRRLSRRNLSVEPESIHNLFVRHDLVVVKKTSRSR